MVKRALAGIWGIVWPLLALALLICAVLLAVAAVNTWRQGSRQPQVPPLPVLKVDADTAAASLATAVRAKTVSGLGNPEATAAELATLRAHLKQRYPLVFDKLALETVGEHTLVFTWKGSDAALKPVALMAHQDVVPIAPGTEALWKQPPFEGRLEGGFVWGRGAFDDKGNLIAELEAVQRLLEDGFAPRRTVYLVFGHDEEVGGERGVAKVVQALKARGVRFEAVLDEGMFVTEGLLPGIAAPVALVALAEKGSVSIQLTATAKPGHSSAPPGPGQSAIGILSAALARVDAKPLPGGLTGVAREMFDTLAPEMSGFQRLALTNLWLFGPVVELSLGKSPTTNALMRTTTALTIVQAGNKENVLPGEAKAVINFRILPGDTSAGVLDFVKRTVADERVEVKIAGLAFEPSRISSSQSAFYGHLQRAALEVFPGAKVAPGLMVAATDSRHFEPVADNVYRFMPLRVKPEDVTRFHGTDERLAVANLAEMIRFYHRLLQLAAGPASEGSKTP